MGERITESGLAAAEAHDARCRFGRAMRDAELAVKHGAYDAAAECVIEALCHFREWAEWRDHV
jgi:hypothetical protein